MCGCVCVCVCVCVFVCVSRMSQNTQTLTHMHLVFVVQAAAGELIAELDKLPPLDVAAMMKEADDDAEGGGEDEGMM